MLVLRYWKRRCARYATIRCGPRARSAVFTAVQALSRRGLLIVDAGLTAVDVHRDGIQLTSEGRKVARSLTQIPSTAMLVNRACHSVKESLTKAMMQ